MPPSLLHLRTIPLLILILALQSPALPTDQPSLVTLTSNTTSPFPFPANPQIPHCYLPSNPDTPGIQPTTLTACRAALTVLVHTPHFATPFRFSRNPRAMAKPLPIGWQLGAAAGCRIVVNCDNDRDTAVFRLADVARVAKRIMDNCVERPDPHGRVPVLKWGGRHGLNAEETFYVAVAKPREPAVVVGGNGSVGGDGAGVEVA